MCDEHRSGKEGKPTPRLRDQESIRGFCMPLAAKRGSFYALMPAFFAFSSFLIWSSVSGQKGRVQKKVIGDMITVIVQAD